MLHCGILIYCFEYYSNNFKLFPRNKSEIKIGREIKEKY